MYSRTPSIGAQEGFEDHMPMHYCSNIDSTVAKRGFHPIHASDILGLIYRIIKTNQTSLSPSPRLLVLTHSLI